MKKIIALSAAALLGSSVLAAPALAQINLGTDAGVGVTLGGDNGSVGAEIGADADVEAGSDGVQLGADTDADVNVETGDSEIQLGSDTDTDLSVDTDTTAAIGGSFDGALSAIARGGDAAASINSMTEISTVNVVHVDELEGADMDAFATAETDNSASIDELRASVEGNAAVKAALDAQSVSSDQIVAADVNADGSLTVYVR